MPNLTKILFIAFLLLFCAGRTTASVNVFPKEGNPEQPAAISFFVIDLKYNKTDGVQICEIQPGVISLFKGYDFVHGSKGAAAENFCDVLSSLHSSLWCTKRITDSSFPEVFRKRGYPVAKGFMELKSNEDFASLMTQPVFDPSNIHDYHGILYTRANRLRANDSFQQEFPGILIVDSLTYDRGMDKSLMNKVLSDDEVLRSIKPACKLYPRKYSSGLAEQVQKDLGSEMFVIKPSKGSLGRGIIIVDRGHLAKTLKKVMKRKKELPKKLEDSAYRYWAKSSSKSLIIEAYAPSITVSVPHLKGLPYDPTMRMGVVVASSQGKVKTHFVACYWKLPKKALSEKGSLTELHKSYGQAPYFAGVEKEVQAEVERQLSETLPRLYTLLISESD